MSLTSLTNLQTDDAKPFMHNRLIIHFLRKVNLASASNPKMHFLLATSAVNSEEIKTFAAVKQHRFSAGWAQGSSIKVQKPSVIQSVYLNTKVTLKHQLHDTTASGPSNRFIPIACIQSASKCTLETIELRLTRQRGVNKADLWLKTFRLWCEPHRWDQMFMTPQCTSKPVVAIATLSSIRPPRCWKPGNASWRFRVR